jgi:phage terminase small subunit
MGQRGPIPRALGTLSPAPLLPPPAWLPVGAEEVWREVAPHLAASGRLTPITAETFAAWCCTASELRRLAVEIDGGALTTAGPHGPVPSAAVSAASRLRTVLVAVGKGLGLDAASDARIGTSGRNQKREPTALEAWRIRHGGTA